MSLTFEQFYRRFSVFGLKKRWLPPKRCSSEQFKTYSQLLCEEFVRPGDFQIGLTKLFTRQNAMEGLNIGLDDVLDIVVVPIQVAARRKVAQLRFGRVKKGIRRLQAVARMRVCRAKYLALLDALNKARIEEEKRRQEEEEERKREQQRLAEQTERLRKERAERERQEQIAAAALAAKSLPIPAPPDSAPPPPPPLPPAPPSRQQVSFSDIQNDTSERGTLTSKAKDPPFIDRVSRMHDLCTSGDLTSLQAHLTEHPEDYIATDPRHKHCGILHSAAKGSQLHVLRYLNPTAMDIVALLDSEGNNLLHYAALSQVNSSSDQLGTFRFLIEILEGEAISSFDPHSKRRTSTVGGTGGSSNGSRVVSFKFTNTPSALISHTNYLRKTREAYEQMETAAQQMMLKTAKRSSLYNTTLNSNSQVTTVSGVIKSGWLSKRF